MKVGRILVSLLILHVFMLEACIKPVLAETITTEQAISSESGACARAKIAAFFARNDTERVLVSYGVTSTEAGFRIASLSDDEALSLSQEIDRSPVAGDALSTVLTTALVIFLVLLTTDILGFTKVFPFTRTAVHSR